MATQLATLFLRKLEVPVVLTDVDAGRAESAAESIRGELAGLVAKGRLREGKARFLGSIVTAGDGARRLRGLRPRARGRVRGARRQAARSSAGSSRSSRPSACSSTNTSSLSVAAMARRPRAPERVVGLHFFNPVAVLPLVEVVRTPATDDASLATAWDVTRKLGKRGVLVQGRARRSSSTAC